MRESIDDSEAHVSDGQRSGPPSRSARPGAHMTDEFNEWGLVAFVLGLIGTLLGVLIFVKPFGLLVFPFVAMLGLLAWVFSLVGLRKPARRSLAIWGTGLGSLCMAVSLFGAYLLFQTVDTMDDLVESLGDEVQSIISESVEEVGAELAPIAEESIDQAFENLGSVVDESIENAAEELAPLVDEAIENLGETTATETTVPAAPSTTTTVAPTTAAPQIQPEGPLDGMYISVIVSAESAGAAEQARYDLEEQYLQPFGILLSSDYRSLRPGYWVVYAGPFVTAEASQNACWYTLNKRSASECYGRRLSQDLRDVDIVYPPAS